MNPELINYITELNAQCGRLQGMLEAVCFWDIPEELKERIRESLENIKKPEFPNPSTHFPEPIFHYAPPAPIEWAQTGDPVTDPYPRVTC